MNKSRKRRGTVLDAIILGAFQSGVSMKQIARHLKLSRERVEDGIRLGGRVRGLR